MTAVLGAALSIGLLAGPAGAQSDPPGYGEHSGDIGLHWILDNPGPQPELPAVTCVYGGTNLRLKLMRIRQPVLLANTADGHRRQEVGWKAVIEHSTDGLDPWAPVVGGGWTKAIATAPYPADLAPKELALPAGPLEPGSYRVRYSLRWYNDNGSVDGIANHIATWYRVSSPLGPFTTDTGCQHTLVLLTSARVAGRGASRSTESWRIPACAARTGSSTTRARTRSYRRSSAGTTRARCWTRSSCGGR